VRLHFTRDVVGDELLARRFDVGHHEIEVLDRASGRARDSLAEVDGAR